MENWEMKQIFKISFLLFLLLYSFLICYFISSLNFSSLSFSLPVSSSSSLSLFLQTAVNVGHPVWKLFSCVSPSFTIQSFILCLSSFAGDADSPGWARVAGWLAWLDTAVLDIIHVASGESRSCTITRPGRVFILRGSTRDFCCFYQSEHSGRGWTCPEPKGHPLTEGFQQRKHWHSSCLLTPSKKDHWNALCPFASKIHHTGPSFSFLSSHFGCLCRFFGMSLEWCIFLSWWR